MKFTNNISQNKFFSKNNNFLNDLQYFYYKSYYANKHNLKLIKVGDYTFDNFESITHFSDKYPEKFISSNLNADDSVNDSDVVLDDKVDDKLDVVSDDDSDDKVDDKLDVVSDDDSDDKVDDKLDVVSDDADEFAVEVSHLTMEFKINKDKIDTLKEYVIRTIKRNKVDYRKIKVLDDINFKVKKGDRLGIIGLNGAGKSTLLKILAGIYEPTSGDIKINGKIAPLLELGAGFDNNYSGKNNIFLNAAFLGLSEDYISEKFDEIVEFSELGEYINYPVKNYSSGMRAKLGFSIATLVEPDILIIDEILSVGDIKFKKKSAEKIKSLIGSGITVLLVSHSVSQIKNLCNRAIWIEDGKLVMEGEVDDVCDAYVEASNKP